MRALGSTRANENSSGNEGYRGGLGTSNFDSSQLSFEGHGLQGQSIGASALCS